jgi:hypothetical protein
MCKVTTAVVIMSRSRLCNGHKGRHGKRSAQSRNRVDVLSHLVPHISEANLFLSFLALLDNAPTLGLLRGMAITVNEAVRSAARGQTFDSRFN